MAPVRLEGEEVPVHQDTAPNTSLEELAHGAPGGPGDACSSEAEPALA
jgi:hypothetical protein